MTSDERLHGFPVIETSCGAPALALDGDFSARWAAWVAHGQAHDAIVRRKLLVWAGVLAIGTATVFDLVH